jgi:hypothetical protein
MNSLATIQDNLAVALFDPLAGVPAAIANVDLRAGVDFRHAGIGAFLVRALAARYPVVRRLIGDDSFLDVARRFVAKQPPRLPIVQHFGETFPHYLRSLGEAASFDYVADIAELEAARAHAYHSADAPSWTRGLFRSFRWPASMNAASSSTPLLCWSHHAFPS